MFLIAVNLFLIVYRIIFEITLPGKQGWRYGKRIRPRTAFQWHRACYFVWDTILVWGSAILVWGGTSSDLREHGPGMPLTVAPDLLSYRTSV